MIFLYSFVSTFLINYLVIWIISLFHFRNHKLVSAIVISLINILSIIYNSIAIWEVYVLLVQSNQLAEYTSNLIISAGNLIANIIAYIATIVLLLDGKKLFKSRRQQQYANAVSNKKVWPTVLAIVILALLGVGCLIYGIFVSINFTMELLLAAFGAYGMALAFFGVAFYIFFINFTKVKNLDTTSTNSNVINATVVNKTKVDVYLMFILHLGSHKYYFEGLIDQDYTINYYLGDILNIYVLTDFGSINTPTKKYIVKGIKVDKIDENTLKEIKLTRVNNTNENFLNLMTNFERYHLKTILADDNFNILKIIEK